MKFRGFLSSIGHCLVKFSNEMEPQGLNLSGDRDIEWSWVAGKVPNGSGKVLNFGCGPSGLLSMTAARRGFEVVSIDQLPVYNSFAEASISIVQGDILKANLSAASFDLVINCSTVEHVGLAGRYGTTNDIVDGDLQAMGVLRKLMKPEAVMLLTIPVGQDAVFAPDHRVYGIERLCKLLEGYVIDDEEYWVKNSENKWVKASKEDALSRKPKKRLYGLGCFELGISNDEGTC